MSIFLTGPTGTRRIEICNWMCENLRYEKAKTYTTNAEICELLPEEFIFVTQKDMLDHLANKDILLIHKHEDEYYGIDMNDCKKENYIVMSDISVALDSKKYFNSSICYVDCTENTSIKFMEKCGLSEQEIEDIMKYDNDSIRMLKYFCDFIVDGEKDISDIVISILTNMWEKM